MGALEIAIAVLGIAGTLVKGAADAIGAATSKKEDEAFAILDKSLAETKDSIGAMRAKLAENKAAAEQALRDKFGSTQP